MQTSIAGFELPRVVGADITMIMGAGLMKTEKFTKTEKIAVGEQ